MIQEDILLSSSLDPGFRPYLKKNDRAAKIFIWVVSIIVFSVITILARVKLNVSLGFDPHLFAATNAILNSCVTVLLIAGLLAVRRKNYVMHRKLMFAAIILSFLFLLSYICHHLFTGDTKYGDLDNNGIVSADEKTLAGSIRIVYYFILLSHIPLAGIILPFILFTSYRSLTGEYEKHKKLARITWPVWLYVAITGVIVYLMISPYYD
jgi:putative membrane protein